MNFWKIILVTVVIFGTGVITGGLLGRRTQLSPTRNSTHPSGSNHVGEGFKPERALRMDFVTRVQEELGLTQGQIEQIETIVQESQARTRQIWEQCSPQMRAEFKATQDKIREVLTPIQRERFEELMKRRPPRKDGRERPPHDPELPPSPPASTNGIAAPRQLN